MGHLIQQTGNDEFRVWSTVVDDFVCEGLTGDALVAWYVKKVIADEKVRVTKHLAEARDPKEAAIDAKRFGIPLPAYMKAKQ